MARARTVVLDGERLTLGDVVAVAREGARVAIAPAANQRMARSRRVIEGLVRRAGNGDRDETVYGVTTGFGNLARVRIPARDLETLQLNLVRSHAAGMGDLMPDDEARALMALRANALAKGFSGVRPEVVGRVVDLLNAGIVPEIPEQGSVGASGDLVHLAHLALALVGEGSVRLRGRRVPAAKALKLLRLKPVRLQAKEGLALVNGTQFMTAVGMLALADAERLLRHAEIAAAMSLEALMGSVRAFDERIVAARPFAGALRVAGRMRRLLAGSRIVLSHKDCDRVQDPYSFRCIPQVLGSVHDSFADVRRVLETEANSATDNPLVFPDGDILSGGNFHGQPVAVKLAELALAVAEMGSFSERRTARIVDAGLNEGLPPFLTGKPGLNSGLMIPQYVAASLVNENKALAWPAPVDSIPTSANTEDHVSMGATMARHCRRIVQNTRRVLAIELLCAAQALELRSEMLEEPPAKATAAALAAVRKRVARLEEDRWLAPELAEMEALVRDGDVVEAVERSVGPLG